MPTVQLDWCGPFGFRDLLTARERYDEFGTAGVYVHLRRRPDGSREYLYVGRASGSPDLMQRQVRHYVGSVGLLYYLEPKLVGRKTSQPDFEKAADLLLDRTRFKDRVDAVFEEMDSQRVYLAKCDKAEASSVEAALISLWNPVHNRRKERGGALQQSLTIHHRPVEPGLD